jgi:hypothetical protein
MAQIGTIVIDEIKAKFDLVARARGTTSSRLAAAVIADFLKQGEITAQPRQQNTWNPPASSSGKTLRRRPSRFLFASSPSTSKNWDGLRRSGCGIGEHISPISFARTSQDRRCFARRR